MSEQGETTSQLENEEMEINKDRSDQFNQNEANEKNQDQEFKSSEQLDPNSEQQSTQQKSQEQEDSNTQKQAEQEQNQNFDDIPVGKKKQSYGNDEQPIGGSGKYKFDDESQLQQETQKGTQKKTQNENQEIKVYGNDEVPIGGKGTYNFDEQPIGGQKEKQSYGNDEVPIGGKGAYNFDEQPIGGQKGKQNQGNDEVPIGGKGKYNFDEQPIGSAKKNVGNDDVPVGESSKKPQGNDDIPIGGSKTQFGNDDVPIGGGLKVDFGDEYPPEGQQPKPKPKKPVTKKKPIPVNIADQPIKANVPDLDEIPVGGGQKFEISEYPEGEGPQEQVEESLPPLPTRLKSKVWKMRMTAFEEMTELFNSDPSQCNDYYEEWPKFINDNNPGSQEKALLALKIFIEKSDQHQFQNRFDGRESVKVLIDKCIAPGKPQIKKLSFELIFDIFEKKDKTEMFEAIQSQLVNKNQKIVQAAIQTVVELLIAFGPKRLDFLKPFFGEIEKQAQSTVSGIRNECITFYKEAFKWMGEQVLQPFIAKLKKQQQDELEKFFKEWEAQPMKPLRGGQTIEIKADSGSSNIDAYDIVDAVDIFNRFNEKWCDKVLALAKWNEKTAMLEEMIKATAVPKISPAANYSPFMSFLKKLLNEANANVNMCAIKLTSNVTKGLRRQFNIYAKQLFPLLMIKLRDKKTMMIDETKNALDNFHYAIGVEDIVEDLKEGLNDKAPQMRVQITNFICRTVIVKPAGNNNKKYVESMKQLIPLIRKMLDDSVPECREASLIALGKMKPYISEQLINQYYNDITDQKKKMKINELAAQQVEETKPKQAEPQPQQTTQQENTKSSKQIETNSSTLKKPPLQPTGNEVKKQQSIVVDENLGCKPENAETVLRQNGVYDEFFILMEGSHKEKVQAIQELQNSIDAILYQFDAVFAFLKKKTRDFRESNLQINKEIFQLLHFANSLDPRPFDKKSIPIIQKFFLEKVTDTKFKDDITAILQGFCECISPRYVVAVMINSTKPKVDPDTEKTIQSPPKVISETIYQVIKVIDLVTVKYLDAKELIDFGKENVIVTMPLIKNASIELMKVLYQQIGPDINSFLLDLPAQNMKTLENEFSKLSVINPEPKIQLKEDVKVKPIQEQLPRIDISKDLERIMKKLNDSIWNKRKEGIEDLEKMITGVRLSTNGLNELFNGLKARLGDQNKNVIRPVINLVGKLSDACGKDFKQPGKQLIYPLVGYLSDKNNLVRQDALNSIEKIGQNIGMEQILIILPTYLTSDNVEMKLIIIQFIIKYMDTLSKQELKHFVQPLTTLLCDRSNQVRQVAEQLTEKIIIEIKTEPFENALKDLKPALKDQVCSILSKYGVECDYDQSKKKQGKTPKQKMEKTLPTDNKRLNRIMTTKDLQNTSTDSHLNNSTHEYKSRTPKKGPTQDKKMSNQKMLPSELTQMNTPNYDQKCHVKPVFLEGSLIATQVSIRELKQLRQDFNPWIQETFSEMAINDTIADLRIAFKPSVTSLLFSPDYRQFLQGLNLLNQICGENVHKINLIEVSDLVLKYLLVRIYGGCANGAMLQGISLFLSSFCAVFEKIGYNLNNFEIHLGVKILRELVYADCQLQDKMVQQFLKITQAESVLKLWIEVLLTDASKKHQHLLNQQSNIECEVIRVITYCMINVFTQETLQDLARFSQIQQYPELISELQRVYGQQPLKRSGILQQNQQEYMSQKFNLPGIQIMNQSNNSNQQNQQDSFDSSPRVIQFRQCLNSLLSQNTSTKIESLMQFNDIISGCSNNQPNQYPCNLLIKEACSICNCFHTLLHWSFQTRETVPTQFIQFLLQAIQKLFTIKSFVRSLPYDALFNFSEDLLQRLLAEDETKHKVEHGDSIVKQLNSTTLRILENADMDMIYCVLLDLLIKHRGQQQGQQATKMVGLLVKCIIRITKSIDQNIKVDLLLLKFHNYISQYQNYPNFSQDDQGAKTIRAILQELIKLKGDFIWESYQIVQRSDSQDQYLHQWIRYILGQNGNVNGNQMNMNNTNNQFINQYNSSIIQQQQIQKNENRDIEWELKQASEKLKNQDTFEQGVKTIVDLVRKNGNNVGWEQYTQDCGRQMQIYIQQQIDQNNSHLQQSALQQMRLNNQQQQQLQQSQANQQLEQKVNSLRYRNTLKPESTCQQQEQSSGQQLKTPEYLMQRLNDMKNKVQTLVGNQNKFN